MCIVSAEQYQQQCREKKKRTRPLNTRDIFVHLMTTRQYHEYFALCRHRSFAFFSRFFLLFCGYSSYCWPKRQLSHLLIGIFFVYSYTHTHTLKLNKMKIIELHGTTGQLHWFHDFSVISPCTHTHTTNERKYYNYLYRGYVIFMMVLLT